MMGGRDSAEVKVPSGYQRYSLGFKELRWLWGGGGRSQAELEGLRGTFSSESGVGASVLSLLIGWVEDE